MGAPILSSNPTKAELFAFLAYHGRKKGTSALSRNELIEVANQILHRLKKPSVKRKSKSKSKSKSKPKTDPLLQQWVHLNASIRMREKQVEEARKEYHASVREIQELREEQRHLIDKRDRADTSRENNELDHAIWKLSDEMREEAKEREHNLTHMHEVQGKLDDLLDERKRLKKHFRSHNHSLYKKHVEDSEDDEP